MRRIGVGDIIFLSYEFFALSAICLCT
jgi:hypothetical protein